MISVHRYPTQEKELQSSVLQLLNWTEEEYSHFIFETGFQYLDAYFGQDGQAINFVKTRKEFWTWFKNLWYYRDQSFVEAFDTTDTCQILKYRLYKKLHNPHILACDIYPSRYVLGLDFPTINTQPIC